MGTNKKSGEKEPEKDGTARDEGGADEQKFTQYMAHDPEKFVTNVARVVEEAGKAASAYLKPRENGEDDHTSDYFNQMAQTFGKVGEYWISDPQRSIDAQTRLWGRYMDLWGQSVRKMMGNPEADIAPPRPDDKRFKDPEWDNNYFFDFIKQLYIITSDWAGEMVDQAEDLDDHTRHKAKFYLDQIVNALSPSNFVLTNPELLRETMQNDGANLIKGMQMMAEDIQKGGGDLVIRQTNTNAFALGRNIALTPGKVIAQNEICQVIQYEAQTNEVLKTPLLIVPPWINKYYILDLNEQKSFVKWCVEQGHTVFMVSWVNPDEKLKDMSFFDYMELGILESLETVRNSTGEKEINVIGYCVGGTLLATAMSYLASKRRKWIKTATFFASQMDFTKAGDLKVFIDEEQLHDLEEQMWKTGYLDGKAMANAFNMLRSNDLIWPYFINNYMRGKEPFPFDLLYWNSDSTRMAAANHAFYLRKCYLENALAEGKLEYDGRKLRLSLIKVPVYSLATKEDHIAPAESVFKGCKLFGGPVDYVLSGSGHIAGVVNPPAKKKYQFWRNDALDCSFEEWKDSAKQTAGSWWPDWHAWVEKHDPEKTNARPIGSDKLVPIEDAPGSFVKVRY